MIPGDWDWEHRLSTAISLPKVGFRMTHIEPDFLSIIMMSLL